ncbi:MAG TPA: DUF4245 domain-containing protein [Mycobacteriales bacterium]|nr:DUF4245 domain-containing protein [Mycobacteriales bacterium]
MSGDAPASDAPVDGAAADVVRRAGPVKTFSDMARSLGLMAVVIAVLLLIGPARTLVFPGSARMQPVDYSDEVAAFDRIAGSVLAPSGLPKGWRANAATFERSKLGTRLHVGFATPGSGYAGLDETDGEPSSLLRKVLGARGATTSGTTRIDGRSWQLRRSDRGEQAFTLMSGGLTVVVTGSASDAQLRTLAGSLR